VPPVSFCNGVPREHPSELLDSQWVSGEPPTHQANALLAKIVRPSFLRSGVAGLFEHVDPRHGDRSPRRIYPNLTDPSTPVASTCLPPAERLRGPTVLRYGPLPDAHTRPAETSPTSLLGPLTEAPREREPRRAASRVPSTQRAFRSEEREVESPTQ